MYKTRSWTFEGNYVEKVYLSMASKINEIFYHVYKNIELLLKFGIYNQVLIVAKYIQLQESRKTLLIIFYRVSI